MTGTNPVPAPAPRPVRYAEKRRTSTCSFADRIAQFCLDHYREQIPSSFRETQKQTCLAAIVALVQDNEDDALNQIRLSNEKEPPSQIINSQLYMLGMGVGTKFLSNVVLKDEITVVDGSTKKQPTVYGKRVRDCHAEVLARRAFRRQLSLEILRDLNQQPMPPVSSKEHPSILSSKEHPSILQRNTDADGSVRYKLRPGTSLHMYASSAPCGNATVRPRR